MFDIILNIKDLFYLAAIMLSFYLFYKERSKLLDRIMSRNYQEYEYYEKMFKGEVEELKEQRDEAKKEVSEDEEIKEQMDLEYKKEKEFIKNTDEDWEDEDIDYEKLRKRTKG